MMVTEAWAALDSALNHEVLDCACLEDKKLYRRVVQEMSKNLRRRPQMLLGMPRPARHELFRPLLGLPQFETLAQNLAIRWLRERRKGMMVSFLDTLGVVHDGAGMAESFPETMEEKKLLEGARALAAAHGKEAVFFYLNIFDQICGVEWPGLAAAAGALKA
jgi:hypothetical protein